MSPYFQFESLGLYITSIYITSVSSVLIIVFNFFIIFLNRVGPYFKATVLILTAIVHIYKTIALIFKLAAIACKTTSPYSKLASLSVEKKI